MSEILIEKIKNLGYNVEVLDKNIFLINNFLTDSECESFIDYIKSSKQHDWQNAYMQILDDFVRLNYGLDSVHDSDVPITENWQDKILRIKNYDESEKIQERLMNFFDENLEYECSPFNMIQRQYDGSELPGHYDKFVDKTIEWAAVTYLNDDYSGGYVYFEKKKIKLKPPAKSILIFPSTEEYWHGVELVGPGPERYVLPVFIHEKGWNKK